jgi:hypothetical protein|nr:MAG TPA: hypothetical protein [Caudoviricetes sp.]
MNWQQIEEQDIWICKTPIGKFEVIGGVGVYNTYLNDKPISRFIELEKAKEEAKIHLIKTYYSLKIYLEIDEQRREFPHLKTKELLTKYKEKYEGNE